MTASHRPIARHPFTTPVVDYEPAPVTTPSANPCPTPSSAALHRHTPRPLRSVPSTTARPRPHDPAPPRAAALFADTALRRVLEVVDRRRPTAQLRSLLAPALFDAVAALTGATNEDCSAVLRRVRLRTVALLDGEAIAAEVFATYTRGRRVRAIAGRIDIDGGRWVVSALQLG